MLILKQNNNYEKGTWKGLRLKNGEHSASISCPECGNLSSITDHDIASDGTVSPSLVCPYDDCSFHDFVKLDGWIF